MKYKIMMWYHEDWRETIPEVFDTEEDAIEISKRFYNIDSDLPAYPEFIKIIATQQDGQ